MFNLKYHVYLNKTFDINREFVYCYCILYFLILVLLGKANNLDFRHLYCIGDLLKGLHFTNDVLILKE